MLGGEVALLKEVNIIHNHGGASRINIRTANITKTEVVISKHVYLSTHFKGFKKFVLLSMVILNTSFSKTLLAIIGSIVLFHSEAKIKHIFVRRDV